MLVTLYRSLQNFKIEKIDNTRVSCLVASTLHYKRVCLLLVAPSIALSVLFLTVSYIVYHIPCFKLISNTAHFHYTFDSSATITPLTGRTVVSTGTCLVDYSYTTSGFHMQKVYNEMKLSKFNNLPSPVATVVVVVVSIKRTLSPSVTMVS